MRIDSSVAASSALTRRPDHAASVKTLRHGAPVTAKPAAAKATQPAAADKASFTAAAKGAKATSLQPSSLTRGGVNTALPAPAPASPPETSEAHGPGGTTTNGMTLEGLRREWGQTGSSYDLNGDKTVNVDDLIQFLLNYPGTPPIAEPAPDDAPIAQPQGPPTAAPVPPAPPQLVGDSAQILVAEHQPAPQSAPPTDPNALLNGIRKSWGETSSAFDLNNDQTVNVDDLMHLLLNWPGSNAASLREW